MRKAAVLLIPLLVLFACFGCSTRAEDALSSFTGEKYVFGDYEYIIQEDGTVEITKYLGREEELVIPEEIDGNTVTVIGDEAFADYRYYLYSIVLPDSITRIGNKAFLNCIELTSATLPKALKRIGDYAFSGCRQLTSINIPDGVTSIGANPFRGCVYLTDIMISPDHFSFDIVDGALIDKNDQRLIFYPCAFEEESYIIPD